MELKRVDELNEELKANIQEVIDTSRRAYAPYSNYGVCAMIVDKVGDNYKSVNCEVANYDGTCGEAGAVASYITGGRKGIDYIVVYGASLDEEKIKQSNMFATPCGRCRQRLYEHAEDNTKVYAISEDGSNVKIFEMQELLPERFSSDNL